MNPLAGIFELLKICRLFLNLRLLHELRREQDEQIQDEARIADLRARGDPISQLAADRLRQQLERNQGVVSRIVLDVSSSSPSPTPGAGNKNT